MKTVALTLLMVVSIAAPAAAMDCEKEFRVRVEKMMAPASVTTLPKGEMISLTRWALQGYDACMKGDMKAAEDFFSRASRAGG